MKPARARRTTARAPQVRAEEVELRAVLADGPGGQNVNKVATAIHLRFDIVASSLPQPVKARLRARNDRRITSDGVVIIKANRQRTLERNRADALQRLQELVTLAAQPPRVRKATRPTLAARKRRLESKRKRSRTKSLRGQPGTGE